MKSGGEARMPEAQTDGSNATHGGAQPARTLWGALQWWPTLLGIGLAAFIAHYMTSASTQAPVLAASGLVYLGAAALRKPSAAWPLPSEPSSSSPPPLGGGAPSGHQQEASMRKRLICLGIGAAITLLLVATPIVLAPSNRAAPSAAAPAIDKAEHARTIEALRPPKRDRPAIAILALNEATEVTDFLIPYGILSYANVADVVVVAERAAPVPLHPFSRLGQRPALLRIEPQSTTRAFDERYPEGAGYVVVPAMEPRNNQHVTDWIAAQHRKGAKIISVCAGALTLGAAGLLDGRRATTHWAYVRDLQKAHPTMQWVPDRRYVVDDGVFTSTGITASIPVAMALVEAIAGRPKAEQLARELGVADWDARHRSSEFQLTWEHQKTFLRNWLSLWRWETLGVPVGEGVDEIALALTVDAYSRTALSTVVTVGSGSTAVRSRHGLVIHPNTSAQVDPVDHMLPPRGSDTPARSIDTELAQIAARFGRPTADIVALAIEYPWVGEHAPVTR